MSVRVQALKAEKGVVPCLAVVLVGDDPASHIYVRNKERGCKDVGMESKVIRKGEETTQQELADCVDSLANDSSVHGILVQLPLPKHLDPEPIIMSIPPNKDVDGLHVYNIGCLNTGASWICGLYCKRDIKFNKTLWCKYGR